jgi:hypothetical protein
VPAKLRGQKVCYESQKKIPGIYCKCQWGPV